MVADTKNQRLIVGLGNPGLKYEQTYHNLGFQVIDGFARKHGVVDQFKSKFDALFYHGRFGQKEVPFLLVKPMCFMNLSGGVVLQFLQYFKVSLDKLLIISDDLDLPLAKLRFRPAGGDGGHNGLKNISLRLGGRKDFARLRFGIGPKPEKYAVSDYVLAKISPPQQDQIDRQLPTAIAALENFLMGETIHITS